MKRYTPALKNTDTRTNQLAKGIRTTMIDANMYEDTDAVGVALLASLLAEYEELDTLDLEPVARMSMRIRLAGAISTQRKGLGLSKAEKARADASRRGGGRPKKNEGTWDIEGVEL